VIVWIDLAGVGIGSWYSQYLRSVPPTAIVEELELVASQAAQGIVGILQFIALVTAAICFIQWFRQAYLNVAIVTGRANTHNPKWATWGFFVPVLNLFRPQQMMREIWDGTYARWVEEPSRTVKASPPRDLVNLWWGAFIVTSVVGNLVGRLSWRATTAQQTLAVTSLYLIADSVHASAAVIAIAVVRGVTELQRPLLAERAAIDFDTARS